MDVNSVNDTSSPITFTSGSEESKPDCGNVMYYLMLATIGKYNCAKAGLEDDKDALLKLSIVKQLQSLDDIQGKLNLIEFIKKAMVDSGNTGILSWLDGLEINIKNVQVKLKALVDGYEEQYKPLREEFDNWDEGCHRVTKYVHKCNESDEDRSRKDAFEADIQNILYTGSFSSADIKRLHSDFSGVATIVGQQVGSPLFQDTINKLYDKAMDPNKKNEILLIDYGVLKAIQAIATFFASKGHIVDEGKIVTIGAAMVGEGSELYVNNINTLVKAGAQEPQLAIQLSQKDLNDFIGITQGLKNMVDIMNGIAQAGKDRS